jgi:hypothetical protein
MGSHYPFLGSSCPRETYVAELEGKNECDEGAYSENIDLLLLYRCTYDVQSVRTKERFG